MRNAITVSVCLFCSGCATILKGNHQDVTFASNPPGAKVYVTTIYLGASDRRGTETPKLVGTTPVKLSMETRGRYQVKLVKEGYADYEDRMDGTSEMAWLLLDVFTLGVGYIVDGANGSWFSLPTKFSADLEPVSNHGVR